MIVAVHSFRGGTGKSNITANLAAAVACSGARVGIVDTDLQSPGIHVLFGLGEENLANTLNDVLWGRCSLGEIVQDVTAALHSGMEVPAAPGGAIYLAPASFRTADIARILREGYDIGILNDSFHAFIESYQLEYLFIDTHPGLNEETLLSIAIADVVILILRPDQQDFQGTAVTVEVARNLEVPRLLLVINKVLPSLDRESLRERVGSAYGCAVAAILPLAEEMVLLGSGDLFRRRYPEHPIAREVDLLAHQLAAAPDSVGASG